MTDLINEYNLSGLVIGAGTFLIIGLFHPIVIKAHYHFGTRCRWWFLLLAVVGLIGSIACRQMIVSILLGVLSFSSLWSIGEILEQEKRVARGWFPANPKRKSTTEKGKQNRAPIKDEK